MNGLIDVLNKVEERVKLPKCLVIADFMVDFAVGMLHL